MGLFHRSQIQTLNDHTFGEIIFERGLWASLPNASRAGLKVIIEAPSTGPTDVQRDLFRHFKSQFQYFSQQAVAFIQKQMGAHVSASARQAYVIEIGTDEDCRAERFVLELSDAQADVVHRVYFDGGTPQDYGCDD